MRSVNVKNVFLFLVTLGVSVVCFSQEHKDRYEIKGTLSGFPDSTWIFLDEVSPVSFIPSDSCLLLHHQFHFTGAQEQSVRNMFIRTRNFSDYKYFWLEKGVMTFRAEKGKFQDAVITGSTTQQEQDLLTRAIEKTGNEKEQNILFIRSHPRSIVSANILNIYATTWGRDTTALLYEQFSDSLRNTVYGRDISHYLTLNKNVQVGDRYVDFTQENTEGKNIRLSDFAGKLVLLEFWGSWCGPCRKGNPELVKIYNEYKAKGFDILGVAADDEKKYWVEAVRKDSLPWQNVSDLKGPKNSAALIYGISYFPSNFLIDRNGIIIAKDLRGEDLRKKLAEMTR